ncbi:hypothetical protein BJ875DRAFT_446930 [Amylocarpus encephaloides]|uniref:histidine kinase n=1 Tax=Amylocarpus encephaloides TaxID=45428 RepID=A0A9P7Y8F9_9HELO|nr:hypothetical protein BJ875DRAFT_446930 [Amylocarpus encephaloides]
MAAPSSETKRLREVHKFYRRTSSNGAPAGVLEDNPGFTVSATALSSPNQILTALMQLIACKLGMQRAIVSIMDEGSQYFLAESTKTLDLADSLKHEKGDDLWMGCGVVTDLSKDDRFRHLPYVSGTPHARFYAGTPLLTSANIAIGSVFVMDDKSREPLNQSEIDFLGIMARNVMEYLEMRRESETRSRVELMSKGLAALVEGRSTISPESTDNSVDSLQIPQPYSQLPGVFPTIYDEEVPTHEQILSNAVDLLRESHDVNYTVFLDIRSAPRTVDSQNGVESDESTTGENQTPLKDTGLSSDGPDGSKPDDRSEEHQDLNKKKEDSDSPRPLGNMRDSPLKLGRVPAKMLGCSVKPPLQEKNVFNGPQSLRMPDYKRLRRLVKKYPKGKIWAFGEAIAESSENQPLVLMSTTSSNIPQNEHHAESKRVEKQFLQECFPGAVHLILAPIMDIEKCVNFAACFVISFEPPGAMFTAETEVTFVRAFLNNVSVAYSRASMAAANRQKGYFISSISHELRSPLHGILASVGMKSQNDHALLDTITSILEYTKINTLVKESRGNRKPTKRHSPQRHLSGDDTAQPSMIPDAIESILDTGSGCEDAVMVVTAAYNYHTSTPNQPLYRVFIPPEGHSRPRGGPNQKPSYVTVILNIEAGDWMYGSFPDSIQRIIMNLVGNALKYTQDGFVKMELHVRQSKMHSKNDAESIVELKVVDTGRGMGPDFLQTKLFSAFAQESNLTPGTGLGLHIVKNLVQLQNGTIDITSHVGTGTEVTVKLPLHKTWFHMVHVPDNEHTAIVLVDERSLDAWLSAVSSYQTKPRIIVVCDQAKQKQLFRSHGHLNTPFEVLTIPFGPKKLSHSIMTCLEPDNISGTAKDFSPSGNDHGKGPSPDTSLQQSTYIQHDENTSHLGEQPRILCVDGNPINMRILKAFMEKLDFHNVICASNGHEAFEEVQYGREKFQLIFMDLSMPVCDGFRSIALIRSLERLHLRGTPEGASPPTPALIVALTGLASQRDHDAALEAGADHFVTKPLKLLRLKELLVEWNISAD